MHRPASAITLSFVQFVVLLGLLAGCGSGGPARRESDDDAPPPKPVIIRPVVLAETGSEELVKAVGLLMVKNYDQAEANLEEIIRVRPDIPEAHFNLAFARQQLGKHARAVDAIVPGLALRPNEIRGWLLLALSEREMGQFTEAEATYRAGLALAPNEPRLHLNAGILYDLYLLKPPEALAHYRRYQALQPAIDSKVAGWIVALERKVARDAEAAAKAAAEAAAGTAGTTAVPQGLPDLPSVNQPAPAPEPQKPNRKAKGKGAKR